MDSNGSVSPLALGDELRASVGHSHIAGDYAVFYVDRCDGRREYFTTRISARANRRLVKALRRAFGEAVRKGE